MCLDVVGECVDFLQRVYFSCVFCWGPCFLSVTFGCGGEKVKGERLLVLVMLLMLMLVMMVVKVAVPGVLLWVSGSQYLIVSMGLGDVGLCHVRVLFLAFFSLCWSCRDRWCWLSPEPWNHVDYFPFCLLVPLCHDADFLPESLAFSFESSDLFVVVDLRGREWVHSYGLSVFAPPVA